MSSRYCFARAQTPVNSMCTGVQRSTRPAASSLPTQLRSSRRGAGVDAIPFVRRCPTSRRRLNALRIEVRIRRPLADKVNAERVLQLRLAEERDDTLAVLDLTVEVLVHLVFQLRGDHALAVVVPVRVDAHEQVRLVPVDRVVVDVPFAGARRVEPEAEEPVLPHRARRVVRARDQPRVRRADRLARQRLGDPDFSFLAVVQADVGILAGEAVGAELRADAGAGWLWIALTKTQHRSTRLRLRTGSDHMRGWADCVVVAWASRPCFW